MAKKAKVMHNGSEIEVELPDEFLTPEEARGRITQQQFDAALEDRFKRFSRSMKKDLLADDEFKAEAMKAWDLEPPTPGQKGKSGTPPEQAIADALKEFERTRLNPVMQELEKAKAENDRMRVQGLHAEILQYAHDVGFDEKFTKPLAGGKPAVVAMLEPLFGFDAERGAHLVRSADGKGFAISSNPNPKAGHPYKGVADLFAEIAKDPEYRPYLKAAQKGAGADGSRSTGSQKVISRDDPEAFGREAENILKGTTVVE